MRVTIKRNDTGVSFTDTLKLDGEPVDLTGATVHFMMAAGEVTVDQEADIVSASDGTVRYDVALADVGVAGTYRQEWEVTFSDLTVLTFPNDGHNTVVIVEDLA